MSMRELERSVTEALAAAGDSAQLPGLAGSESNRNSRADRGAAEALAGRGEVTRVWASVGRFEWVAVGYLLLSSAMIFAFSKHLFHPWKLIGAQATVAIFIFRVCSVGERAIERAQLEGVRLSTRFWRFWRCWYPHLFFLFCFEELAYLVHLFNPNWQDAKLITFDHWMFGVHPGLWLVQFATPVRNEFFQLDYLAYFVFLLALRVILYYRKEGQVYWSVMAHSAGACSDLDECWRVF